MENITHNFVFSFKNQTELDEFKSKNSDNFIIRPLVDITEQSVYLDLKESTPVVYTTIGGDTEELVAKFKPQKLLFLVQAICFICLRTPSVFPIRSKRTPSSWTLLHTFNEAYGISIKV